ncbi:MAG: hypothetical protein KDC35_20730 [Acidobacteria bacterium]|nr:hypothetical protein [Acidobacteriota bacterium]
MALLGTLIGKIRTVDRFGEDGMSEIHLVITKRSVLELLVIDPWRDGI